MKQTITAIELAKHFNIEVPDFINDYSKQLPGLDLETIKESVDHRELIEWRYFQDYISEYADNSVPIYTYETEDKYNSCGVSIDDVIEEGLVQPMRSESDINHAKSVAIYIAVEHETMDEFEEFISEISNALDCPDFDIVDLETSLFN